MCLRYYCIKSSCLFPISRSVTRPAAGSITTMDLSASLVLVNHTSDENVTQIWNTTYQLLTLYHHVGNLASAICAVGMVTNIINIIVLCEIVRQRPVTPTYHLLIALGLTDLLVLAFYFLNSISLFSSWPPLLWQVWIIYSLSLWDNCLMTVTPVLTYIQHPHFYVNPHLLLWWWTPNFLCYCYGDHLQLPVLGRISRSQIATMSIYSYGSGTFPPTSSQWHPIGVLSHWQCLGYWQLSLRSKYRYGERHLMYFTNIMMNFRFVLIFSGTAIMVSICCRCTLRRVRICICAIFLMSISLNIPDWLTVKVVRHKDGRIRVYDQHLYEQLSAYYTTYHVSLTYTVLLCYNDNVTLWSLISLCRSLRYTCPLSSIQFSWRWSWGTYARVDKSWRRWSAIECKRQELGSSEE